MKIHGNKRSRNTTKEKCKPKRLLANERTFLAWIRTGIANMAFLICSSAIFVIY